MQSARGGDWCPACELLLTRSPVRASSRDFNGNPPEAAFAALARSCGFGGQGLVPHQLISTFSESQVFLRAVDERALRYCG